MNCPVCKRELAPTLSICLTCGAMMNDTVREELETKIGRPSFVPTARREVPKFEPIAPWTPQPVKINAPPAKQASMEPPKAVEMPKHIELPKRIEASTQVAPPKQIGLPKQADPPKQKVITTELNNKATSPTLVGFRPTNPTVPDWRLQLQNSVRKRTATNATSADVATPSATALASAREADQRIEPVIRSEKLANAIKRIESSKQTFAAPVRKPAPPSRKPVPPSRAFPFDVVERTAPPPTLPTPPVVVESQKPKLVSPLRIEKKKFDTNKLPPIPEPETPLPIEIGDALPEAVTEVRTKPVFDRITFKNISEPVEADETETEGYEEIDDLAPFSMRFGAGVFDLIICGFAAGILVSPLLVSGVSLVSAPGFLAIFGSVLAVMFVYFTATIAFMGRTFGMKLFSIEIIDAEANELPTLHQAAVNSAVFILSLLVLGLGFLPALFNEERRAMHDLVSGTLLIREY